MIQGPCVWSPYYISIFQKRIRFLSILTLAEFPPSCPTPPVSELPALDSKLGFWPLSPSSLEDESQNAFESQLLPLRWTQGLDLLSGPICLPACPRTTNSIQRAPSAGLTSSQTLSRTTSVSKSVLDPCFLLQNFPSACQEHVLFKVRVKMG